MNKEKGCEMGLDIYFHRGVGDLHPENSINGVKSAFNMGCFVEVDVRLSKDHQAFLMHDETLKRTTNAGEDIQNIPVKELTYNTISKTSLCSGDYTTCPPPLLEDVLQLASANINREVVLDVKDPRAYPICFDLIRTYEVESQITFTASNIEDLVACKKALPDSSTSLWLNDLSSKLYQDAVNAKEIDYIVYIVWHDLKNQPKPASIEEIVKANKEKPLVVYEAPWKKRRLVELYQAGVRRLMFDKSSDCYNAFKGLV